MPKKNGSSGRTRTYNPPVNSCGEGHGMKCYRMLSDWDCGCLEISNLLPGTTDFYLEVAQKWTRSKKSQIVEATDLVGRRFQRGERSADALLKE